MNKLLLFGLCALGIISIQTSNQVIDKPIRNLIIFNDVIEKMHTWDLLEKIEPESAAIIREFIISLLEKQLVLVTKSLWTSFQNIIQAWNNYKMLSVDELRENYITGLKKAGFEDAEIDKYALADDYIKSMKIAILTIDKHYQAIQKKITNRSEVLEYLKNIPEEDKIEEVAQLFVAYYIYQIILSHDYICKEVNNEFIIFIPKDITLASGKDEKKDIFLGLSYTKLNDFDYGTKLSDDQVDKIFNDANDIMYSNALGQKLLDALNILKVNKSDTNILKNPQLPFFNIFISGHGDDVITSEISITLSQDHRIKEQKSDMLQILKFFNNSIKTKSLAFVSCYPGGKKFVDTFDIKHPLSNRALESITYPILFMGSFYAETFNTLISDAPFKDLDFVVFNNAFYAPKSLQSILFWNQYFDFMNQQPVEYKKAAELIFFKEDTGSEANLASFKKPNTAWFIPVEFESKKVDQSFLSISQIYALTHDQIVVPSRLDLKRIWLQANYVHTIKFPKRSSVLYESKDDVYESADKFKKINAFPYVFPMNYHNQNYIIEKIEAPDLVLNDEKSELDSSLHQFIEIFFPVYKIKEPIKIVIKKLITKNYNFKNIYIFRYIKKKELFGDLATSLDISNEDEYEDGYIYTDTKTKETKIVLWPYDKYHPLFEKEYQKEFEEYKKEKSDLSEEEIKALMDQDGRVQFKEENFDVSKNESFISSIEVHLKNILEQSVGYKNIEKALQKSKQEFKVHKKDDKRDLKVVSRALDLAQAVIIQKNKRNLKVVSRALDLAQAVTMEKNKREAEFFLQKSKIVARTLDLAYTLNNSNN